MNLAAVRIVAFDLDDTLAESKSSLTPQMADVLADLLDVIPVCVISGGRYEQFASQLLANLPERAHLAELHLMPTNGTRYLRHVDGEWRELYAHDLTEDEKERATRALSQAAHELGLWEDDAVVTGLRIEDRGSQITYSALGQRAAVADKKRWDPDGAKRERLRAAVAQRLPDLEVRAGGSTSIDITGKGIDKAYGMRALAEQTGFGLDEILFIGDRLMPGGNDYPVLELGIACHAVSGPDDTVEYLRELVPQLARAKEEPMVREGGVDELGLTRQFLDIVACPACHSSFAVDYESAELICVNASCGLAYPVRDGIPVLLVEQARRPN